LAHTFTRKQRLLNAAQFTLVFTHNNYKAANAVLLLLAKENNTNLARLGLVIAKKNVKLAVQRNRIKRQLREYFRLQQEQIKGLDLVFVGRKGLDNLNNQQLRLQIASLLDKIKRQRL